MPLISEAGLREQLLAYLDRRVAAPEEELLAQLAQRTGATLETLRERLRRICLELVADGLLERSGPDQWRAVRLRDAAESPDEVLPGSAPYYSEQASVAVRANKYERDRNARRQCIEHYGARCVVCGFDFESGYGALGRGCVRVHHVVPPAQLGPGYRLDPVRDLRP
ncbi:hypothetical protein F8280_33830, partial [Micromonospora noduli]|uniref:HNH endonuclease n=1 Tax=Micromonospora noduli TaxID=709876 RepID=UPI00132A0C59